MSNKTEAKQTPTDLDLMLYADGELEGDALDAVEAYLARDKNARRKMLAMGIVSDVVRDRALEAAAPHAGDIADSVMAALEKEAAPVAEAPKAETPKAEAKVVPLAPRRGSSRSKRHTPPSLWAAAVVAVAAAAGLLIWAQTPSGPDASRHPPVYVPPTRVASTVPSPQGSGHPDAPVAEDAEHGVQVSAVDFGALTGAVFYVPNDTSASSTTTVVWLADGSSGGSE